MVGDDQLGDAFGQRSDRARGIQSDRFRDDGAVGDEQVLVAEHFAVVSDDAVGGGRPIRQPPSGCGVMRSCAIVHVNGVSAMPSVARASS